MAKPGRFTLHISGRARRDLIAILRWSLREFGEAAALRYETLILQALQDIQSAQRAPELNSAANSPPASYPITCATAANAPASTSARSATLAIS